jgi:hypothetical protein
MSNDAPDTELFTKKHNRLVSFAKAAKVAAIFLMVLYGIKIIMTIIIAWGLPLFSSTGILFDTLYMMTGRILPDLAKGLSFGIGLLGISYGLNMIVEIDLNYRIKTEEASND